MPLPSLDLGFAELDVLLGDRIVFLLGELVGHGARVLLGHVVEAGVGARHELDLDGGRLGHDNPREISREILCARNLAVEGRKSRMRAARDECFAVIPGPAKPEPGIHTPEHKDYGSRARAARPGMTAMKSLTAPRARSGGAASDRTAPADRGRNPPRCALPAP